MLVKSPGSWGTTVLTSRDERSHLAFMVNVWSFRHPRSEVRILTRGAASRVDRAGAARPEVAARIARQLFERLSPGSERRATLLAMTDSSWFDANRCSTAALQQNVLDRISRKGDLLVVHELDGEEQCCSSASRRESPSHEPAMALASAGHAALRGKPVAAASRPAAIGPSIQPASALASARPSSAEAGAWPQATALASSRGAGGPGVASVAVGGAGWGGHGARWPLDMKLRSLHPSLRTKVIAVLDGLTRRGYQPKIFFAWRSVAAQLEIYARGHSRVKFSFHNAQLADGTPNAYAADIVDARYGWSNEASVRGFWRALGEEAHAQNLYWGGDWKSFKDWAHVQLVDNSKLRQVKKESGL